MRQAKLHKYTIFSVALLIGIGSAGATDLSGGIKGLKLGMPKAQVHSMLESMETEAGGFFAPACKPDADGEVCVTLGVKLSYGNIPVAMHTFHFGRNGLDVIELSLSMAGCNPQNKIESPPQVQLEKISAQLTQHLGPPTSADNHAKVWIDRMAVLKVFLFKPDQTQTVYPGCPQVLVQYLSRAQLNDFLKRGSTKKAKENDL